MNRAALLAEVNKRRVRVCQVHDCTRPYYAKGYCAAHYRRLLITGDVDAEKPLRMARYPDGATCAQCHTVRPYAKGLCKSCYNKQMHDGQR
jgi:hypothetical protein